VRHGGPRQKGSAARREALSDKQQSCHGRYLEQILDPEKPQNGRDKLSPIPSMHRDRQPGHEVAHAGKKWVVRECKEPLWKLDQPTLPLGTGPRIIHKTMRRLFQYLIGDEVHEQKSDESAQSMACGKLIASVSPHDRPDGNDHRRVREPPLSADDPAQPEDPPRRGLRVGQGPGVLRDLRPDRPDRHDQGERSRRADRAEERQVDAAGQVGQGDGAEGCAAGLDADPVRPAHESARRCSSRWRSWPRSCPTCSSTSAARCHQPGPDEDTDRYERAKAGWVDVACDMTPEQKAEYNRVAATLEFANRELLRRGSMKLLGAYLWTTMDYPDRPWGWDHDKEVLKAFEQAKAEIAAEEGAAEAARHKLGHTVGYWDRPRRANP